MFFAPALIAARPVKPCDGGFSGAWNLLLKKKQNALSEMPLRILPLMKDANDGQMGCTVQEIDDMRAAEVFHEAGQHIGGAALFGALGQGEAGIPNGVGVVVGLICAPPLGAVVPDFAHVGFCRWRKRNGLHCALNAARLRALKASKSNGRGSPDSRPA